MHIYKAVAVRIPTSKISPAQLKTAGTVKTVALIHLAGIQKRQRDSHFNDRTWRIKTVYELIGKGVVDTFY